MDTTQTLPEVRRPRRRARISIGATIAAIGAAFALSGGSLLSHADSDGHIQSGEHKLSTSTHALVSTAAEFEDTGEFASVVGPGRVGLDTNAERDVFVGIGRARDVDRYLAGVQVDTVTEIDTQPFALDKQRSRGGERPERPGSQSFWVARSQGRDARVDWKVRDGDYKLVVMNADGSRGVTADGSFETTLPILGALAIAALAAGSVALIGGLVLLGTGHRPARAGPVPRAAVAG